MGCGSSQGVHDWMLLAWTPSASWLMAVMSVLPRMESDVLVSMLTSDPIRSGDVMMAQSEKCVRCSVTDSPMSPTWVG